MVYPPKYICWQVDTVVKVPFEMAIHTFFRIVESSSSVGHYVMRAVRRHLIDVNGPGLLPRNQHRLCQARLVLKPLDSDLYCGKRTV